MLKKILLASMFVITATTNVTHAEDDMKTVASKAYVDTKIETKQLKIPAAGQPNVGAGETVMTYTATGNGQIGERGLYSDISSYDATTDGDKLITASALNATFTNLPTTPTTKLECANQADGCTLWTIVDQTAYRKSRNLFDLNTMDTGQGWWVNSGVVNNAPTANRTIVIDCKPNTAYSYWHTEGAGGCRAFVLNKDTIEVGDTASWLTSSDPLYKGKNVVTTITTPADAKKLYILAGRIGGVASRSFEDQLADFMVVEGEVETALPYEPY